MVEGKTAAVGDTDQQLLVIGPRGDADSRALTALGASLREWQATRSYARHIWGLDDLLEGRPPRTPPIYLSVPYPCERFEEQFQPVALVFVAAGTDMTSAAEDLACCIEAHSAMLAHLEDPDTYSYWQR